MVWTKRSYQYDAQGNTRALSDDTGAITDTFTYDAWGNEVARTGTTETPFRWNGRVGYYWDTDSETFQVRRRAYGPKVGQWSSIDQAWPTDSPNAYGYCRNSSVNFIDPTGLKILIFAKTQNADFVAVNRDAVFINQVLEAFQLVIGDCALIKLKNTVVVNRGGRDVKTYAELTYSNENKGCTCDPCWQELKAAIDHAKSINIYRIEAKYVADEETKVPNDAFIYVDPAARVGAYEIDPKGGAIFTYILFPITLWHETLGHAYPGISTGNTNPHSTLKENEYSQQNAMEPNYTDPAVEIENRGRACLRNNPNYKNLRDRVHRYFNHEDRKTSVYEQYIEGKDKGIFPQPGATRSYSGE